MKREKRAGRSLGGGGIHSSGSLGDGAWQEGWKRREVSRSLAEARVLGGRGTQALPDSGFRRHQQSPRRSSITRPGAHAQLSNPRLEFARGKPAWSRERGTKAGNAARMRSPAARAPQDGEGKVEFSSGNLTR